MSDTIPPQVQRMLVLSTMHISQQTDQLLEKHDEGEAFCPLSHQSIMYGWLIYIPYEDPMLMSDLKAWVKAENMDGLAECLEKAASIECEWLKLDCDVAPAPGLPVFDWD